MVIKKTDRNTPWAKRRIAKRKVGVRLIKNPFLIFCEGEITEKIYFESFPVTTETKIEVFGKGKSKMALVDDLIKYLNKNRKLKGQENFDVDEQIWCVFDMDFDKNTKKIYEDFDNAIRKANSSNIKVAYSNDSFELWFVLHHRHINSALTRKEYYKILSEILGFNYEKYGKSNDKAEKLYGTFFTTQKKAIDSSKKLYLEKRNLPPHKQNPCTKVYELVNELNKCLKK